MSQCLPAIFVVPRGGVGSPEEKCPPVADIVAATTEGLEAAGWSNPSDIVVDAREGELEIQDEVPPTPPVDVYGVAIAFSQTEATFTHGYRGPFQVAMEAIHAHYPDLEVWISAVPRPGEDR